LEWSLYLNNKEELVPSWIYASDIETDFMEGRNLFANNYKERDFVVTARNRLKYQPKCD